MPGRFALIIFFTTNLTFPSLTIAQDDVDLGSENKKYSYAVGTRIGQQLVNQFGNQPDIEIDALLAGLNAIASGTPPLLSDKEAADIISAKQQEQLSAAAAAAGDKVAQGNAFLEKNKEVEGVIVTDSGLQYKIITDGGSNEASPTASDTVVVHYKGTLMDGTEFDSSYSRGEPATFALGSIIPGWKEVLQMMKPGDKWAVVLPSEIAYGENGAGKTIGPNEVLLFDIELLEVKRSGN